MGIIVKCDKCDEEIVTEFWHLVSEHMRLNKSATDMSPIISSSYGDDIIVCNKCYKEMFSD